MSHDIPQVLVPFDPREVLSIGEAARMACRSKTVVRGWCGQFCIGRSVVSGRLFVSKVALQMLLDGNSDALQSYLAGDRSTPSIVVYFERAGIPIETLGRSERAE